MKTKCGHCIYIHFIAYLIKQIVLLFQTAPLDQMLYLADNLGYFPFQVQDEPLFIIHHIDIIISTSGSNLLQHFREVSTFYLF